MREDLKRLDVEKNQIFLRVKDQEEISRDIAAETENMSMQLKMKIEKLKVLELDY